MIGCCFYEDYRSVGTEYSGLTRRVPVKFSSRKILNVESSVEFQMTGIEFDVSQNGLNAVLKDWELKAMQVVWRSPQGANSRPVWLRVNEMLGGGSISRASIINFLEEMRGLGVLGGEESRVEGHHTALQAG